MGEKISNFIYETLKISFVLGGIGALLTYFASVLSKRNKDPKKAFNINALEVIIHVFIGVIVAHLVSTVLPNDYLYRDAILGGSGALAYPVYTFFERVGIDLIKELWSAIVSKISK